MSDHANLLNVGQRHPALRAARTYFSPFLIRLMKGARPIDARLANDAFLLACLVLLACFCARIFLLRHVGAPVDVNRALHAFWSAPALAFVGYGLARFGWGRLAIIAHILALRQFWSLYALEAASYVYTVGAHIPFADAQLARMDALFGFSWPTYADAFLKLGPFKEPVRLAYCSIAWQPAILVLGLVALGRVRRVYGLIMAFCLSLALTTAITYFFPAIGAFEHFQYGRDIPYAYMNQFSEPLARLRAGDFAMPLHLPLVQFPSFHTACGLLFIWAAWPTALRWPALLTNLLLLAGTPVYGSHYLTDMIGGAGVAVFSILLCGAILRRRAHSAAHAAAHATGVAAMKAA